MSTKMFETGFPIKRSQVYQFFLVEKQEIERLKWLESEQVRYDIGWDHARFIWFTHYREGWLQGYIEKNFSGLRDTDTRRF